MQPLKCKALIQPPRSQATQIAKPRSIQGLALGFNTRHQALKPRSQAAPGGLGRYIKRKSMDPLETYVPAVLQARSQLLQAGAVMGALKPRGPLGPYNLSPGALKS